LMKKSKRLTQWMSRKIVDDDDGTEVIYTSMAQVKVKIYRVMDC
jgi:hypothetical protein